MKVGSLKEISERAARLKEAHKKIVFTNGCFDLLHVGHVRLLQQAKSYGDVLIVGINSDASMRQIKGPTRPLVPEAERAEILAALESVDHVTIFDDISPLALIEAIAPNVLIKGADWGLDGIIGRVEVERSGGQVIALPLIEGQSTSGLIEKIKKTRSSKVVE